MRVATPPPRVHVVVLTYRRPALLARLLKQLRGYRHVSVDVFDDDPESKVSCGRYPHHIAPRNHGKRRFWQWINHVFMTVRGRVADRYVFLPDDVSLCADFFTRCEERWRTLPRNAVSMNLLVDHRAEKSNWTSRPPRRYNDLVEETWWVDGCFYANTAFFAALNWHITPIAPSRWSPRATMLNNGVPLGSGVWHQATLRLFRRGYRMFRSWESLVYNHGAKSLMNPIGRRAHPAETVRWIDA